MIGIANAALFRQEYIMLHTASFTNLHELSPLPSPPQHICAKLTHPSKRAKGADGHGVESIESKLKAAAERRDAHSLLRVTRARSNSEGNRVLKVITQNLDRLTRENAIEKKTKAATERREETLATKRDKARRSAEKKTPDSVLAAQQKKELALSTQQSVEEALMRKASVVVERKNKAASHAARVEYKRDRVQVRAPLRPPPPPRSSMGQPCHVMVAS